MPNAEAKGMKKAGIPVDFKDEKARQDISEINSSLTNKLLIGRSTITGDNTTNKASKVIDITATNPNGLAIKGVLLQWLDTDNIVTYADYLNVVTYSATSLTISTKWRTANNYSWQFEYVLIT